MGSPQTERGRSLDEGPTRDITIDYDFYLGETEVTGVQWESVMGDSGFFTSFPYPDSTSPSALLLSVR